MTDMMSPADMKAVMGSNGYGEGNGMNSWWWIIILFLFRGNMFGGGEGQTNIQDQIRVGFDTQAVTNKLNGIENGICSSTFSLNNSIKDVGFATTQTGYDVLTAVNAGTVSALQSANATQREIADCC